LNDTFSASSIKLLGGYGLAADLGLVASIGPVMLGLSARDFGLEFKVGKFNAQDIIDSNINAFPLWEHKQLNSFLTMLQGLV